MKTVDDIIKYTTPKQLITDLIAENVELKSIVKSLKISLAEQSRVAGIVVDELLILKENYR